MVTDVCTPGEWSQACTRGEWSQTCARVVDGHRHARVVNGHRRACVVNGHRRAHTCNQMRCRTHPHTHERRPHLALLRKTDPPGRLFSTRAVVVKEASSWSGAAVW